MNLAIIGSDSLSISYSDNAMAQSANASDRARVSRLESENRKLQEELNQSISENQSLQAQISHYKSAVQVDIEPRQLQDTKEISTQTKEYLSTNNINMANESANFTKQSVQSQAGSMIASQANGSSLKAQKLLS